MYAERIASQLGGLALRPMKPLTDRDRSLLQSCPKPGEGVHAWTFKVLCMLARHTPYDSELRDVAVRYIRRHATRTVTDYEIQNQISNARRNASGRGGESSCGRKSGGSTDRTPAWPPADLVAIEKIIREGPNLAEIIRRSPILVDHKGFATSAILELLFPKNPLLCCGRDQRALETKHWNEWADLDQMQFIVPSPMYKVQGLTKEKKPSCRCLDNTGPRRFLVIEFDLSPVVADKLGRSDQHGSDRKASLVTRLIEDGFSVLDMCSALLWHLSRSKSLAMVVHSGGKSLHGWFYCKGESEDGLRIFMHEAVRLGADPATWTRCQLVRMPEGARNDASHQGVRQAVHYFDLAAISAHGPTGQSVPFAN